MKVLVTGASGFLGRAVTRRLTARGHDVTGASRGQGVDLLDATATRRFATPWRWDAVVHLAGPAPKQLESWDASVDTVRAHVGLLAGVLGAIPSGWAGRFVLASGAIVYGNPERLPVTEEHARRPLHAYGLAKCLTEDILLASNLADRWALRMGGLFSSERRGGALFHFMRAAREGGTLAVTTNPPVPWELLHVDDAAEAIARALESPRVDPGPMNVGYGEPVHLVEIAERLARRGGRGSVVEVEGPSPPVFQLSIDKAIEALRPRSASSPALRPRSASSPTLRPRSASSPALRPRSASSPALAWPPATLDERLEELWRAFAEGA